MGVYNLELGVIHEIEANSSETILVISVAMCGMLLLPRLKTVFALLPPAYLLIERHARKRPWADLGFRFSTFWEDLRANWFWFLLVGVIMQPLVAMLAKAFIPAYLEHVISRLPFPQDINWFVLIPMLAFSLIAEELTFRTLIQGRLTPYFGKTGAVLLASLLFGIAHFSPGAFLIVCLDIAGIFIDSILYGIIFARSSNLVLDMACAYAGRYFRDAFPDFIDPWELTVKHSIRESTSPWIMVVLRTVLFGAFQAAIAGILLLQGAVVPWDASAGWWPIAVVLTDLVCLVLLIPPDFCSDPRSCPRRSLAEGRDTLRPDEFPGEGNHHQRPWPVLLGHGQFGGPNAGQRSGYAGAGSAAVGDLFLAGAARLPPRPAAADRHAGLYPVHLHHDEFRRRLQRALPGLCGLVQPQPVRLHPEHDGLRPEDAAGAFLGETAAPGIAGSALLRRRFPDPGLAGAHRPDRLARIKSPCLENVTSMFIQAMDLGLIVPLCVLAGILLLRREAWGYLLASVGLLKFLTMGIAVSLMGLNMARVGVPVSIVELVVFLCMALTGVVMTVVLLKHVRE